jgi:hypothetical protein
LAKAAAMPSAAKKDVKPKKMTKSEPEVASSSGSAKVAIDISHTKFKIEKVTSEKLLLFAK